MESQPLGFVTAFAALRVLLFIVAGAYAIGSAVLDRWAVERMARMVGRPKARLVLGLLGIFPLLYGLMALAGLIRLGMRG